MSLHQQEIVRTLLDKFPNSSMNGIARMAYKESPQAWSSLQSASQFVRRLCGRHGKADRTFTADKSNFREPTERRGFPSLPKPLKHFNDWAAVPVNGPCLAAILSDIHIPYHDDCLEVALIHAKNAGANVIILNGDVGDFFSVSRYEKDPTKRKLSEELLNLRQFLKAIRDGFPKAKIIFKLGNHEERWESYLAVKAPELIGVEDFEFHKILRTDELDIQVVGEKRPILLGKLFVIHGHEFMRSSIAAPVNPARGFFLRAQTHVLGGHHSAKCTPTTPPSTTGITALPWWKWRNPAVLMWKTCGS
jgi:predicted phosphodiesterase